MRIFIISLRSRCGSWSDCLNIDPITDENIKSFKLKGGRNVTGGIRGSRKQTYELGVHQIPFTVEDRSGLSLGSKRAHNFLKWAL